MLVLEDNPYGLLGFDAEPMRALRADEPEGVVYLGSFSKTFAPGMRVGWALAPHAVREKLVLAQESATLCPPAFSQMAVSAYLAQHDWRGQIKQIREMYRERRDAMIEALHDFMPAACQWNVPHGGFYVWMTLPPGIDAKAMLPRAVTARVAYVPGTAFFADGFGSGSMRLSLLLPHARADPRGRTPPGRRPRGGAGAARDVRRHPRTRPRLAPQPSYDGPGTDLVMTHPVVVLAGGLSHERDVSLRSGRRVAEALRDAGARGGRARRRRRPAGRPAPPTRPRAWSRCCTARAVRTARSARSSTCSASRTSGAGPAACRTAFDKPVAKSVVERVGITTPESVCLPHETFRELGAAAGDGRRAGPARAAARGQAGAQRLGARLRAWSQAADELPDAMVGAFAYGAGRAASSASSAATEVAVPVVDDGSGPRALPAVAIRPDGPIYDYTARYTAGLDGVHGAGGAAERRARRSARGWPWPRTRRSACATCRAPT